MGSIKNDTTILLNSSKLDQPVNKSSKTETMKETLSSKNHSKSWLFAIGVKVIFIPQWHQCLLQLSVEKSNSNRSRKQYEKQSDRRILYTSASFPVEAVHGIRE